MANDPNPTTERLDDSVRQPRTTGRMAIRWVTPGVPSTFLVIDDSRATIGRGPDVTVALDAAGLSRCHVEIYRQGPAYIIHDLGSTNGTHVNGRRVEYAPLAEEDVVRLGDVLGVVARVPPEARPDAPNADVLAPDLAFGPGLAPQIAEIRRVAPGPLPVLIVGETGTGKEFVARAVHVLSRRRGKFHAVNCAALPAALAEAELFGHSRGAFTGAEQATLGHVRAADGGTLFLDELAELPLPLQAKLLRVLQDGQVTPLGETRSYAVDLRVVSACQQEPGRLVDSGSLRQDLVARLAGLTVTLPPLRERRADVAIFFRLFLDQHGAGRTPQIDPRMLECMLLHDWPANLRELDLLTRRLLALHGEEPLLRRSFLPAAMLDQLGPLDDAEGAPSRTATPEPAADREQYDCRRLREELRRQGGNITRAAAAAGISRARAYRLMGDRSPEQFLAARDAIKTDR